MTKHISFTVDNKGCWNCTSHKKNDAGYAGRGKGINGNYKSLAKELYEKSFGSINAPLELRHLCGNRICINLSHLTTGTRKENLADREMHGTVPRGEKNPHARLREEQVKEIIILKNNKNIRTARTTAKIYGVSPQYIRAIWRGEKWGYLQNKGCNCKFEWCYPKGCDCPCHKQCSCKHGSGAITKQFVEENKLCKCECHKNAGNTSYQNNKEDKK